MLTLLRPVIFLPALSHKTQDACSSGAWLGLGLSPTRKWQCVIAARMTASLPRRFLRPLLTFTCRYEEMKSSFA
ncbi:hypothetical protein BJV74DRAFT_834562 [Russula compacta]|nr:hypothetical protein BJV74DRAFT_834562 [Russula compacta]